MILTNYPCKKFSSTVHKLYINVQIGKHCVKTLDDTNVFYSPYKTVWDERRRRRRTTMTTARTMVTMMTVKGEINGIKFQKINKQKLTKKKKKTVQKCSFFTPLKATIIFLSVFFPKLYLQLCYCLRIIERLCTAKKLNRFNQKKKIKLFFYFTS